MKKIQLSFLFTLMLFASCGKRTSTPDTPSNLLHGLWYYYNQTGLMESSTIEFKDKETGILTSPGSDALSSVQEPFTYTFQENILSLTIMKESGKKEERKSKLNIISKDLIISLKNEIILSKSSTLSEDVGRKYLSYIPKTIIGKWDLYVNHQFEGTIEFKTDNSYKISLNKDNASGQKELTETFTKSWNKLETRTSDHEEQITNLYEITKDIIIMPWFLDYNMTILTPTGYDYSGHRQEINQAIEKFRTR